LRWTLPARTAASTVARITAAWPEGAWIDRDAALAMGLPAPLRKLLSSA
jgi:A/G-specific adenine glycosylase